MLSFVFFFKKTLFSTILKAPFGCAPRTIQSKICPIETHPYVRNATNYNRYLKSDIAESDFTRYCIPQIMPYKVSRNNRCVAYVAYPYH